MLTRDVVEQYISYDPVAGQFLSRGAKYSNRKEGERVGTLHSKKGYRYITIQGKVYREHRVAFLMMTGEWPKQQVDHINGIKDDNRWENLRDVAPSINCQNRGMFRTNKSGYKGVVWQKNCRKWQVLCRANGNQAYLGVYDDVHEAGRIANDWYSKIR